MTTHQLCKFIRQLVIMAFICGTFANAGIGDASWTCIIQSNLSPYLSAFSYEAKDVWLGEGVLICKSGFRVTNDKVSIEFTSSAPVGRGFSQEYTLTLFGDEILVQTPDDFFDEWSISSTAQPQYFEVQLLSNKFAQHLHFIPSEFVLLPASDMPYSDNQQIPDFFVEAVRSGTLLISRDPLSNIVKKYHGL